VLFIPLSYGISLIPIEDALLRFILLYGTFNVVNCLASIVYYYWFHAGYWHRCSEAGIQSSPK
jgi:hypothetical protein